MASSSLSPNTTPQDALLVDGYIKAEDAQLARRAQQLEDEGVAYASQRGLRFCTNDVLNHQDIKPILSSAFQWSALGLYRSIGPASQVNTFESAPDFAMQTIIIMVWSQGSSFHFWPGSHRHWLHPVEAANSLLTVPRTHLEQLGLKSKQEKLDNGGFTVHDSRVAFSIEAGTAIVFAVGTKEAILVWNPMELPASLERIVADMESANFVINARYVPDTEIASERPESGQYQLADHQ